MTKILICSIILFYILYSTRKSKTKKQRIQRFTNEPIINNIILVCTHGNVMKCFFSKLYTSKGFKNCAAVACININNMCRFKMIYEGEDHYNGNNNWSLNEFNTIYNDKLFDIAIPKNKMIIIMRHAKGTHNGPNVMHSIKNKNIIDPELDEIGYAQAEKFGKFFNKYIQKYNSDINFGSSNLIRTQMTISIIQSIIGLNKPVNIIPCIEEIVSCNIDIKVNTNKPSADFHTRSSLKPFCNDTNKCKEMKIIKHNITCGNNIIENINKIFN